MIESAAKIRVDKTEKLRNETYLAKTNEEIIRLGASDEKSAQCEKRAALVPEEMIGVTGG